MPSKVALKPIAPSALINEAPNKIPSRTPSESKTYALVVGKILNGLSITIGVASIVGCIVVGSIAAFGFIPAAILGLIGLYLIDKKPLLPNHSKPSKPLPVNNNSNPPKEIPGPLPTAPILPSSDPKPPGRLVNNHLAPVAEDAPPQPPKPDPIVSFTPGKTPEAPKPAPTPRAAPPSRAISSLSLEAPPARAPIVPPVGLTNASCNCWINSLMQMFLHIPSLNRSLRLLPKEIYTAIHDVMDQYEAAQARKAEVAAANTQEIRVLLHDMSRGHAQPFSPFSFKQEDASQGLVFLLRDVQNIILNEGAQGVPPAPFFIMEQAYNGNSQFSYDFLIGLAMNPDQTLTFSEMLGKYFRDPTRFPNGNKWNYLQTAPSDLLIQLNRFYVDETFTLKKNNSQVNVPMEFQLPADYVRSQEKAGYVCDAFIEHIGKRLNSGHYECYVKKEDQWFRMSDRNCTLITEAQAKAAMKRSYIFHFSKKT